MYTLFHLKTCFKCMCLHLEFECFASKLEMATSYAWSRPLSLWWWHVLLSVMCDHTSSAVHSWLGVFTVILYPRKYGLVTSRLCGDSAPTASIPGSATQLMSLGQDSHCLTLIFIFMSEGQHCHCCAVFSSCPCLTEMSCRQDAIDP